MKSFTNHTPGPRGLNLKNGTTRWVEPGETVEFDEGDIADGGVPDFGKPGGAEAGDEIDRLRAEVDRLTARNTELEALLADDGDDGGKEPATADDIKTAVALLDGKNDEHWTDAGLPAVAAVAELAGKPVTRAAITEAAPEAKRPAD